MKRIKLYIAISLDGYIARPDGDIDWLTEFPNPSKIDYGYKDFFESVDMVIVGGQTYRDIICMDVVWPYKSKTTYVVTRNPIDLNKEVKFITENIFDAICQLKRGEGRDIWLVGGGELTSMLLNENLIDEMIITHIPIILGQGIPLFPNSSKESRWNLKDCVLYDNHVYMTTYIK